MGVNPDGHQLWMIPLCGPEIPAMRHGLLNPGHRRETLGRKRRKAAFTKMTLCYPVAHTNKDTANAYAKMNMEINKIVLLRISGTKGKSVKEQRKNSNSFTDTKKA